MSALNIKLDQFVGDFARCRSVENNLVIKKIKKIRFG